MANAQGKTFAGAAGTFMPAVKICVFRSSSACPLLHQAQLPLFEIKSVQLPLVALLLKSTQLNDVARELEQRYGGASPVSLRAIRLLIDLTVLRDGDEVPDGAICCRCCAVSI